MTSDQEPWAVDSGTKDADGKPWQTAALAGSWWW